MLTATRFIVSGLLLAAGARADPPPAPSVPANLPEPRTPEWGTELVRLGAAPVAASCLSVVPDGRWLIYTREDQSGSDLMLVENFR